jgi:hypothetical protein
MPGQRQPAGWRYDGRASRFIPGTSAPALSGAPGPARAPARRTEGAPTKTRHASGVTGRAGAVPPPESTSLSDVRQGGSFAAVPARGALLDARNGAPLGYRSAIRCRFAREARSGRRRPAAPRSEIIRDVPCQCVQLCRQKRIRCDPVVCGVR